MSEEFSIEEMMDLQRRIQLARAGEGDMPSREELLRCYTQLRQGRAAAAGKTTSSKSAKAAAALPLDLNDLFA
jgi:hypothetical protein